ncbi:MAG: FAD-dependent oxidoreductase [Parvularculaceae bacterium]
MSEHLSTEVDLLIIGAGMAGMTAAAFAAGKGLSVGVVEKAPKTGGSALYAAGGMTRPLDLGAWKTANAGGDPVFADMLFNKCDETVEWIESLGVDISAPANGQDIIGTPSRMRGIDILKYLALCRVEVENAGGWIITDARVERLLFENDEVVGAVVTDRDGTTTVRAKNTIVATGGFQGSPELRRRHLGENAKDMLLRANPFSVGDGLNLARSVGGAETEIMDYFYGHVIPFPLNHEFRAQDYLRLAMAYLVRRSLLLDKSGQRFVDESLTYCYDARAVLKQPGARALMVGDRAMRDAEAVFLGMRTLGLETVDRITEAGRSGAHVCEADSPAELGETVARWGYQNVADAVLRFNREIECGAPTSPKRQQNRRPLAAPFFAIEIQPAITFTFGGLRADGKARVIREDGTPIGGLLAAGADVGGFYCERYCSGLAMAAILAIQAVETAIARASP